MSSRFLIRSLIRVDIRRLTIDLLNILKDVLIYNKTQNINLLHFLRENEVSILKTLLQVT